MQGLPYVGTSTAADSTGIGTHRTLTVTGDINTDNNSTGTHVSLESPFFGYRPWIASVSAPWSSLSSKIRSSSRAGFLGSLRGGSIICSAVSFVLARESWLARKKSSGPRGGPGSEDSRERIFNHSTKTVLFQQLSVKDAVLTYCVEHSCLRCCVLLQ